MEHDHSHHHHNAHPAEKPVEKQTANVQKVSTDKPHHVHDHGEMAMPHEEHIHAGHDHSGMIEDFRQRFIISLLLSIPVVVLSPMVQEIIGYRLVVPFQGYIAFILSTIIFFYGGWPFLKGLADELRHRSPGMMTLIGIAITVAYVYSSATIFGLPGMDFFWELATLIVIMLLGHYLEMKSIQGASKALELLVSMMPSTAHRIENGQTTDISIKDLRKGDRILIKPGEKIPADGKVLEGQSEVNESMLTGESVPVNKEAGNTVIGGSVNGNGAIQVEVQGTGSDSYLNKVIRLVQEAQQTKSRTQRLADKAARILTYVSLIVGFLTLIVWLMLGKEFSFALERMVTVMVISCPHALGLAIPLVVAISTAVSARNGLLIRNRTAFENARKITTVIFDKTGTLTKGSHEVQRVVSFDPNLPENEILRLAAAVEQNSEHYISRGILRRAETEGVNVPPSTSFNYMPGLGLEGEVEGQKIKVVGPNYLQQQNISLTADQLPKDLAETLVVVLINDNPAGYIALADQIREDAAEAVQILKEHGIKNLLLTGDNEQVASSVSETLKMDGYLANVLPHQKQEKVKELQAKGEFVAMTGDGVNDAPALAQADVGIAVGSGTDVAAETADIILVNSNPRDIASLILFGRATYRKMVQNLVWATAYNAFAIPLAAGVLYSTGFVLSPAVGAVFMSLSTIVVAVNAQLLRKALKSKM